MAVSPISLKPQYKHPFDRENVTQRLGAWRPVDIIYDAFVRVFDLGNLHLIIKF